MAAAFSLLSKNKEKTANLPLRQVVEIRAKSLSETGQSPRAKKGLSALRAALHYRGVKNTVLKAIQTFE